MSTITNEATFAIGEATLTVETAEVMVLPIASPGAGAGRLIHPTLGTFDYEYSPDRWRGFHSDVVVPPVWSSVATMGGVISTLHDGSIEDVLVEEHWDDLAITTGQLDLFNSLYQAPPDPTLGTPSGYVKWFPSYASDLGFYVILLAVDVGGGQGMDLDPLVDQGWVQGPVTLRMRIVARVV